MSELTRDLKPLPWGATPAPGPLVLGVVSPLGINSESIRNKLKIQFGKYNYTLISIKISKLLEDVAERVSGVGVSAEKYHEYNRLKKLMEIGDRLRRRSKRKSALALLAISKISRLNADIEEKRETVDLKIKDNKYIFVIESIKNPGEIECFKQVYGDRFLSIAMHLSKAKRKDYLVSKFKKTTLTSVDSELMPLVDELLDRDESGSNDGFGQDVRQAFADSDAFIDLKSEEFVSKQIERILDLWFGSPFITPTKEEFGMFIAYSSSLKSADLSRQVGAAILSDGAILSIGYNEVPKPLGGSYWENDPDDFRDFKLGKDYNAQSKIDIYTELAKTLFKNNYINKDIAKNETEFVASLVNGPLVSDIKLTRIANLIEFGRIVHAEMMAITDAASRGVSIKNSTLICTTFPCHMCAKHIISSGISKVLYIEPYPKSMTNEMYDGLVVMDETDYNPNKPSVIFQPFFGVGPNKYIQFFKMKKRKDNIGNAIEWDYEKSFPEVTQYAYNVIKEVEIKIAVGIAENPGVIGLDSLHKEDLLSQEKIPFLLVDPQPHPHTP